MPKKTFFNLPEAKRERFLQVALEEFAQNDYRQASITRIVDELGIAKGSLYQYFKNKEALYLYLLELSVAQKKRYILPVMEVPKDDFFGFYKALIRAGLDFDRECPLHSRFLYRASQEEHLPQSEATEVVRQQMADGQNLAKQLLQPHIQRAQQTGYLRADLPSELITAVVVNHMRSMLEVEDFRQQAERNAAAGKPLSEEAQLEQLLEQLLDILKNGIRHSK